MKKNITLIIFFSFLLGVLVPYVWSSVIFYTDELSWLAAVTEVEKFVTNSSNIATADEVLSPPGNNAQLGSVLTFNSVNTGLSWSFKLEALQNGASLVFNDEEHYSIIWPDAISVGDIDNHEDDDWKISILSGPDLTAFAFNLINNDYNSYNGIFESLLVFGRGDILLGKMENIPTSSSAQFLGLISTEPFVKIVFDEDAGDDDIAISDFRFAKRLDSNPVPEPTTGLLLASGLGLILARKRKGK